MGVSWKKIEKDFLSHTMILLLLECRRLPKGNMRFIKWEGDLTTVELPPTPKFLFPENSHTAAALGFIDRL